MKLIVLADNRKIDDRLESEHGLSVYCETHRFKYLLDTGASDIFIRNAEKLGVDLKAVDYVFISHGHADHIGGLTHFLKINQRAKIILSAKALNQKYYSKRTGLRNISIELNINEYPNEFIFVDQELVLEDEFKIFNSNSSEFSNPLGNKNLFRNEGADLMLDDFNHELIACIGSTNLMVFTGCGHKGLLNILKTVEKHTIKQIRYVVGGFHLLDSTENANYETEFEIANLGEKLNLKYGQTEFITGHCTGENTVKLLKKKLEHRLVYFFTGYKLDDPN